VLHNESLKTDLRIGNRVIR